MLRWLSFALCILLCGCPSPQRHATKILLDWWPNPVHIPLYVAQKKGFFHEQGLDVEIVSTSEPPQALLFLASGRADIVLHSGPNTLQALQNHAELRWVGTLVDRPLRALLCLKESQITTPQQLHGRVLGGNPEGLITAYLRSAMKTHGIGFREVKKISWDAPTALLTRAVDVVAGIYWNIEPVQMASHGIDTQAFPIEEFGVPSYEEIILVTRAEKLLAHPELRQQVARALEQAVSWATAHPEQAFELYCRALAPKSQRVREWEQRAWQQTVPLLAKSQAPQVERWRHFKAWMLEHDLVGAELDLETFLGIERTTQHPTSEFAGAE
jgi:ABC-type nitrate/sulfonate/bicarbonate transport system substrate-binding protein